MSVSYIPESVKFRLWGKAGGRCQYCNRALWRDDLTRLEFNSAYIAHIIADKETGPRGDPLLSEKLKADITNLMLMCDVHHRLIDIEDEAGHPVPRLRKMKADHEDRIEVATGITPDRKTTLLLYGANIGDNAAPVSEAAAREAIFPNRFPSARAITIGVVGSETRDKEPEFWRREAENLRRQVDKLIRPQLEDRSLPHLSLFAIAPQPLLVLLGSLLTDLPDTDVFQLHREPRTWRWLEADGKAPKLELKEPPDHLKGPAALVFSLSATVDRSRITKVIGDRAQIWEVTIDAPNNDFLKSRVQLEDFRRLMRMTYDKIKSRVGEQATLHVFPVAPVAVAVEVGRVRMPKAGLPLVVYDSHQGVFTKAIEVGLLRGDQLDAAGRLKPRS